MSKPQFTPGPWKAAPYSSVVGCPISAQPDPEKNTILVAGTRSAVAETPEGFRAEVEANARLIAAAPEIYEALTQAVGWFQQYADGHTAEGDADKAARNQTRADTGRAALAKADGR